MNVDVHIDEAELILSTLLTGLMAYAEVLRLEHEAHVRGAEGMPPELRAIRPAGDGPGALCLFADALEFANRIRLDAAAGRHPSTADLDKVRRVSGGQ